MMNMARSKGFQVLALLVYVGMIGIVRASGLRLRKDTVSRLTTRGIFNVQVGYPKGVCREGIEHGDLLRVRVSGIGAYPDLANVQQRKAKSDSTQAQSVEVSLSVLWRRKEEELDCL